MATHVIDQLDANKEIDTIVMAHMNSNQVVIKIKVI